MGKKSRGSASERLGSPPNESDLEFVDSLSRLCRESAKEILPLVVKKLHPQAAKEAAMEATVNLRQAAKVLEEELFLFALTAAPVLSKTDSVRSRVAADSVRSSAEKRTKNSRKAHLFAWAREEWRKNPEETKSSLARRYLDLHQGINIKLSTAERYLTSFNDWHTD